MVRRACNGPGLLAAFGEAVRNLEAHVDEVNALNVYPVPDGDTGSNMLATVTAALAEGEALEPGVTADRVLGAISFGALMGARGNSGVITSQILRGMSEALVGRSRFTGTDLASALSEGSRSAYRAVAQPVEGTILTVIREAADAAVACAEADGDLEAVLTAAVDAAAAAVVRTPSLLPILREAGVVDSGGQGLYLLLQGTLRHLVGGTPAAGRGRTATARPAALAAHADAGYGYETVFLLQARPGTDLDVDAIRLRLQELGESVLVAGDARAVKVHVHNERPDAILAYALDLGTVSRISVENLDQQVHDAREERRGVFGEEPAGWPGSERLHDEPRLLPLGVVAVVAGAGFEAMFGDFGVTALVRGGQSANPSTGELLAAIKGVHAREILVLPNNPNITLAAQQVASLSDRPVHVVPTRNAAEGLAALLALDPNRDAAGNVAGMTRAARQVQTVAITEAVRDSRIGGKAVRRGQIIALDPDDGLLAVDSDPHRAVRSAVAAFQPGYALLTIYYGDGSSLADAETLARSLRADPGGIEVEVVHGGQPFYRYLVAAD
jgi:DAK2 domain fusion protein YloV